MNSNKIMAGVVAVLLAAFMVSAGRMIHYSRQAEKLTDALSHAQLEIEELRSRPPVRVISDYYYQTGGDKGRDGLDETPVVAQMADIAEFEELINHLNARVNELEQLLAARDRQLAARENARQERDETAAVERRPRRGAFDELRESDPERYREIIERREQMRERAELAFSRKAFFLLNQDLSDLSEEELEEHSRMIALLHDIWETAGRQGEDLPRDERIQSWRAIRESARELEPLLLKARDREFMTLGVELGYSEEEAAVFAAYLNEVIETTSVTGGLMPMGGGGRRGFSMSVSSDESSAPQD